MGIKDIVKDLAEPIKKAAKRWVPIKKMEEEKDPTVLELPNTTYLIKEIPLFKYEWILWTMVTVTCIVVVGCEILGVTQGLMIIAAGTPLILGWALYLTKMLFFMPTGQKNIVEKIYPNRGVYRSVEVLNADREIKFGGNIPPVHVYDIQKHHDMCMGRPVMFAVAGQAQNVSFFELLEGKNQVNAQEMTNTIKTTWSTAWAMATAYYSTLAGMLKDPRTWLMFVILLAVGIIALLLYGQQGTLDALTKKVGEIGATVGVKAAETAAGGA